MSDIIWAGGYTVFTADASVRVLHYNSIFPSVCCGCGTVSNADGIFAVVAHCGKEGFADVGILPFFYYFYPGSVNGKGNDIFTFAGNRACVAAYTTPEVDDHSPSDFCHYFSSDFLFCLIAERTVLIISIGRGIIVLFFSPAISDKVCK